jgi:glycosyltransferase involved in cell wall biosynthesis
MRILLLIPSVLKTGLESSVATGRHPRMDYHALAGALRDQGDAVDLVGYAELDLAREWPVRVARRLVGRDVALGVLGFVRRRRYEAIYTNGENVSIPLALMLGNGGRRPRHVTIGHHLSTPKKAPFFRWLRADRHIDTIFVYAETQRTYGLDQLGIPAAKLQRIHFHADTLFYHPMPDCRVDDNQVCSAGLEWRDYPTVIAAVADMPNLRVKLAAASPWSKHRNETQGRSLPSNVEARRYNYEQLRDLYANSAFVIVPLYENDFQGGITTILEAMAMGKAVVATRTTGQRDVLIEGETGLMVDPGDVAGWREAIQKLQDDVDLRRRLGENARRWVEENATLEIWVQHIACAISGQAGPGALE